MVTRPVTVTRLPTVTAPGRLAVLTKMPSLVVASSSQPGSCMKNPPRLAWKSAVTTPLAETREPSMVGMKPDPWMAQMRTAWASAGSGARTRAPATKRDRLARSMKGKCTLNERSDVPQAARVFIEKERT